MVATLQSALDRLAAATVELRAASEAVLAALPLVSSQLPLDFPVLVPRIVSATAEIYHLTPEQIRSRRKTQPLVTARQLAMALCAELGGATTYQVAAAYGYKDHGTVCWACKSIAARLATEPKLATARAAIIARVATGS